MIIYIYIIYIYIYIITIHTVFLLYLISEVVVKIIFIVNIETKLVIPLHTSSNTSYLKPRGPDW